MRPFSISLFLLILLRIVQMKFVVLLKWLRVVVVGQMAACILSGRILLLSLQLGYSVATLLSLQYRMLWDSILDALSNVVALSVCVICAGVRRISRCVCVCVCVWVCVCVCVFLSVSKCVSGLSLKIVCS